MAVTIAVLSEDNKGRNVQGRDRAVWANITGPASYTTGGETLTLAQLQALCPGLAKVLADWSKVKFFISEHDTSGRRWVLDRTNTKLLCFDVDSEVPSQTNLSAVVMRVQAIYNNA